MNLSRATDRIKFKASIVYNYLNNLPVLNVDFIGRYENLEEDFRLISSQLNIKTKSLNIGLRDKNKDYKDFYNKKTRNFVEKLYQKDVRLFGYNF